MWGDPSYLIRTHTHMHSVLWLALAGQHSSSLPPLSPGGLESDHFPNNTPHCVPTHCLVRRGGEGGGKGEGGGREGEVKKEGDRRGRKGWKEVKVGGDGRER